MPKSTKKFRTRKLKTRKLTKPRKLQSKTRPQKKQKRSQRGGVAQKLALFGYPKSVLKRANGRLRISAGKISKMLINRGKGRILNRLIFPLAYGKSMEAGILVPINIKGKSTFVFRKHPFIKMGYKDTTKEGFNGAVRKENQGNLMLRK